MNIPTLDNFTIQKTYDAINNQLIWKFLTFENAIM